MIYPAEYNSLPTDRSFHWNFARSELTSYRVALAVNLYKTSVKIDHN